MLAHLSALFYAIISLFCSISYLWLQYNVIMTFDRIERLKKPGNLFHDRVLLFSLIAHSPPPPSSSLLCSNLFSYMNGTGLFVRLNNMPGNIFKILILLFFPLTIYHFSRFCTCMCVWLSMTVVLNHLCVASFFLVCRQIIPNLRFKLFEHVIWHLFYSFVA